MHPIKEITQIINVYTNVLDADNGIFPMNSPDSPFMANVYILFLYLTFTIHTGNITYSLFISSACKPSFVITFEVYLLASFWRYSLVE